MDILTTLILSVHEHELSFRLFVSSVSFNSASRFPVCGSFASLVKFTPRYFILFDAVVNGVVFLIALLVCC